MSYYEGIGFTKLFHWMYDADVRKNSVAMVAKVEDIIARFDIGSLSQGILDVSQIHRCKGRLGVLLASGVYSSPAKERAEQCTVKISPYVVVPLVFLCFLRFSPRISLVETNVPPR